MTSMTRTNVFLQNNPPVYNSDQRRTTLLGPTHENSAPPSYEEAINPNGN